MSATLSTKLGYVLGDGTARAVKRALGYETVGELLRHFPRKWVKSGQLTPLAQLRVGDHVTVFAQVVNYKNFPFGPGGKKIRTEVTITDGVEELKLTIFNQPWLFKNFAGHPLGLFAGTVSEFNGQLQLTQPDMQLMHNEDEAKDSRMLRNLIPIYKASSKLSSWKIGECIDLALDALIDVVDPIPESARGDYLDLRSAFEAIHRPDEPSDYQRAMARFIYEEAFVIEAALMQRLVVAEDALAAPRPIIEGKSRSKYLERLQFKLTDGQQKLLGQIDADLAHDHPMHRLLQGEVGSGKTVLALISMLTVIDSGGQAALLAPTEVLAQQHFSAFTRDISDLANVEILTGSLPASDKRAALARIESGEANIIIGTHALIQEGVQFSDLGLVIVDEQHRFGVEQRAALVSKASLKPHVLVMTATPIPRTVALTAFGDLEVSELRELPAGRQEIKTVLVPLSEEPGWFARIWQRADEEIKAGGQVYVVCSRIGEEDDLGETHGVLDTFEKLAAGPLVNHSVAVLHGRMPITEKEQTMAAFVAGEISALVSTTVIEVGIDVANATMMVILDADRFGLAQLHQLRGRVGRGEKPGLCLLVTRAAKDSETFERLSTMTETSDGFEIARLDLKYRREGDVLGTDQSGVRTSLRLLSVLDHEDVIIEARSAAENIVRADPELKSHQALAQMVHVIQDATEYLEKT